MKTYSTILQGSEATEDNAISFAQSYDFSEDEETYFFPIRFNYIDTINSIEIYYDYGADYYFFAEQK